MTNDIKAAEDALRHDEEHLERVLNDKDGLYTLMDGAALCSLITHQKIALAVMRQEEKS